MKSPSGMKPKGAFHLCTVQTVPLFLFAAVTEFCKGCIISYDRYVRMQL